MRMKNVLVGSLGMFLGGCGANVELDESLPFALLLLEPGSASPDQWLAGRCLHEPLPLDSDGQPECAVLVEHQDGACGCDGPWEVPLSPENAPLREVTDHLFTNACVCEIPALTGEALSACQNDPAGEPQSMPDVKGFCYTEAPRPPLDACGADEYPAMLRLYGQGSAAFWPNRIAFICRVEP